MDTIETSLKNIALAKQTGGSSKDALNWLSTKGKQWLILFDNADDPKIDLHQFMPQCNYGNIVITSRNQELRYYAGADSRVSDLEEKDAIALLLKGACQKFSDENQAIAAEIVKVKNIFLHQFELKSF